MRNEFGKLLEVLNINFKDLNLLKQVFIHRSYLNEVKAPLASNERLEFLGDSILSLIVSHHLYISRPQDTEGELTNLRAFIVKTPSLAEVARRLSLGDYLKLSKGEEMGGGRENPQLLANTYEALLGAIFLDQGLEAVKGAMRRSLLPLFEKELEGGPPQDAKSKLQELVQERIKKSPKYKILETRGPDHAKQFQVGVYMEGKLLGRGEGSSKQTAEEQAARQAISKLIK